MRFESEGDINFQLDQLLNQGLEFNDNLKGALLEVDLVAGENTIRHGLGFVPIGYIILNSGTRTVIVENENEEPFKVVRRRDDKFLLFLPDDVVTEVGGEFTGVRIDEWTTEKLFLNASVESPGVRLFVL